jgi:hypothetical protein
VFGGGFALLNFSFHFGPMVNALLFFITGIILQTLNLNSLSFPLAALPFSRILCTAGLPGGVTYLLLVRVKLGTFPALEEKRITSLLNTWLRCPGLVCVAAAQYMCAVSGLSLAPWPCTAVSVVLAFANGVYVLLRCIGVALENYLHVYTRVFPSGFMGRRRWTITQQYAASRISRIAALAESTRP